MTPKTAPTGPATRTPHTQQGAGYQAPVYTTPGAGKEAAA